MESIILGSVCSLKDTHYKTCVLLILIVIVARQLCVLVNFVKESERIIIVLSFLSCFMLKGP